MCRTRVLLVAALCFWGMVAGSAYHTARNRLIETSTGREVLFHGVNVVYKSSPYIPSNYYHAMVHLSRERSLALVVTDRFDANRSFSKEDAQLLNELGLNVIRLGSQWAGVEPSPGVYNQTYIQLLDDIIELCAQYNISVFLDAHQDCFSERFCGEGVPLWAAKSTTDFPFPLDNKWTPEGPKGVPSPEQCAKFGWGDYQLTYAGSDAYQRLYSNVDSLGDHFAGFWNVLASKFKDRKNVLAFEVRSFPHRVRCTLLQLAW